MKRLFLMLIILIPSLIISQEKNTAQYTITGKIIDANTQLPLEHATILFKATNSDQIKFGGITNQRGKFSIDVLKGDYNASVEFLSYLTKKLNLNSITEDLNLGTIELEIDTEYLDEIEIIGEKKTLEFKPNKFVFNVAKDASSAGSMATDVLNHIPSVTVDPSGSITVGGQGQVQIMINGKTSSLSTPQALKSLPAGSIENIEVITNPGSKYKSSSLSVINIILKKGKDEGLNGSITLTGGYKDHFGGLITLNNKTKHVNFFTNANYFHRNTVTLSNSNSEYFNNGITSSFLEENSESNSKGDGFYTTVGMDFYLSKKTTLTTSINYQNLTNKSNTKTVSNIFDEIYTETNSNTRNHLSSLNNEMVEFVADFTHNFNKKGRQFLTYITHTIDNDDFKYDIINSNNTDFTDEKNIENNEYKSTSTYFEFINPMSKYATYTIGYEGDFTRIPFSYQINDEVSEITHDQTKHSAYIDYEFEQEKLYLNLGVRAEFTKLKVDYITLNKLQDDDYTDFSPSASINYSFSDSKSLSLSYKRHVLIPDYKRLQPFEQKYSETSSFMGNPDLDPLYWDAFSLSYSYYGNKFSFSPRFFFSRYNGYWQDVTYETGENLNGVNKVITTPVNLGIVDYYGINLTSSFKASNILNFTGNVTILKFDQSGIFETINKANQPIVLDYTHANFNGNFSLFTQLKIPNVFNLQTNIKHYLNSKGSFSERKAYTHASAAINKDLFDKEASISLTVDDLFLSKETNRDRFDTNYFSQSLIKNKYRTILLSFTYRFNQSKKERKIDFSKKDIKPTY